MVLPLVPRANGRGGLTGSGRRRRPERVMPEGSVPGDQSGAGADESATEAHAERRAQGTARGVASFGCRGQVQGVALRSQAFCL